MGATSSLIWPISAVTSFGNTAPGAIEQMRTSLRELYGRYEFKMWLRDLQAIAQSDEHRQLLQIVTRESERLNGIITDFLAYSRGKKYQFEKVDLLPLLEDTLTLLENRLGAEKTGIRIEPRQLM